MAYYFIKCTHCLRDLRNEDVEFDINDGVMSVESRYTGAQQPVGATERGLNNEPGNIDESRNQFEQYFNQTEPAKTEQAATTRRFNINRCNELFPRGFQPVFTKPEMPENVQEKCIDDERGVLTHIHYIDSSDGTRKTVMTRYCPACGNPLPPQAGMMPTYAILFMGGSSAGKTVYISTVNYLMTRMIELPGYGYVQALPAGNSNGPFHNMTTNLFNYGILPATTAIDLPEPLTLEVKYNNPERRVSKKCLVCFVDMRGEDMRMNGRLIARNSLIRQADAILMAIDPLSIRSISMCIRDTVAKEEQGSAMADDMVHINILSQIAGEILPTMPNGIISVPSAVMMMKMDKIMNERRTLHIPETHWTVNPSVVNNATYSREYFLRMGRSSEELFRQFDNALYNGICGCFSRPYFSNVSALGCSVRIGSKEGNVCILNGPQFIRPIRVMDPVFMILIRLGFLPLYR